MRSNHPPAAESKAQGGKAALRIRPQLDGSFKTDGWGIHPVHQDSITSSTPATRAALAAELAEINRFDFVQTLKAERLEIERIASGGISQQDERRAAANYLAGRIDSYNSLLATAQEYNHEPFRNPHGALGVIAAEDCALPEPILPGEIVLLEQSQSVGQSQGLAA